MTATRTPESVVINDEIAELKAAAVKEIAELQAEIAKADINWVAEGVSALQSEVAFLDALKEIEFSFKAIDGSADSGQVALVRKMLALVNMQGQTAENSSTTRDIIKGRVRAAKSVARTVADVSRDLASGTEL